METDGTGDPCTGDRHVLAFHNSSMKITVTLEFKPALLVSVFNLYAVSHAEQNIALDHVVLKMLLGQC